MKLLSAIAGLGTLIIVTAWVVLANAPGLDWTLGGTYLRILAVAAVINLLSVLRWNPELIVRRAKFGKGTKTWDIVWMVLNAPVWIVLVRVAVQETGNEAPGVTWLLGLTILVFSWALLIWSMVVNPFFEKTVRIQTNHGHRVVDTGPYGYVRHPGYVGFGGWILATPLMLASLWIMAPALLAIVGFVVRTALEDRTLRAELPGYAEYAARVRFRLIPGVW